MNNFIKIAYDKVMLTIVLRSIIIYLIVLFIFRIMGKRQIGQMQPFELVLTLIIADLATIPMAEVSVPVLHGVVPLLTLTILHFILTLISKNSTGFSRFISGKPVIVINPKGIDYKSIKMLNLSIDDILAALRNCGYFSISQVQYAIMETNGKISVMPKAQFAPVTNGDLNTNADESFIPITLICEGKYMEENLKVAGINKEKISELIKEKGSKSFKDVLLFTLDKSGQAYFQPKKGEGISFATSEVLK